MDFSDIVLLAVRKITSGELPPLAVRWLLVDEAQDMDQVQMEWIKLHGLAGTEVTLVGDDDQSLYTFRHAMGYAGLIEITTTLASTETTLPLNYRCAPNILGHAAKLIAHNKDRAPKRIEAYKKSLGEVCLVRASDRYDEGDVMVYRIRMHGEEQEWAILGRTNLQLDPIELCRSPPASSANDLAAGAFGMPSSAARSWGYCAACWMAVGLGQRTRSPLRGYPRHS